MVDGGMMIIGIGNHKARQTHGSKQKRCFSEQDVFYSVQF